MRVLVLSSFYKEPANRDKLRALAGLGAEVIAGTPGGSAATDGPVRLVPIPVTGRADEPAALKWHARNLRKVLTDLRPDLVHVEEDPDSPLAGTVATLCQRLRVPLVLFSWTGPGSDLGLLERRRARMVMKRVAGVIGGNHRASQRLAEAAEPDALSLAVPQTGVHLPPPAVRPDPAELALGFVGRVVPERGLDQLVQALSQAYGKWTLTVLGTGPDQEAIEALVQRFGLASRVRWWGGVRREALDQLWREIDCLVIPSRESPAGDLHSPVLLEAMGHGIAPLVGRAGALPELVGDAGLVADSVEALTEALQRLVAEPARTRPLGVRARQRVLEHYSVNAIAARTHEFWQAVVAAHKVAATRLPERISRG